MQTPASAQRGDVERRHQQVPSPELVNIERQPVGQRMKSGTVMRFAAVEAQFVVHTKEFAGDPARPVLVAGRDGAVLPRLSAVDREAAVVAVIGPHALVTVPALPAEALPGRECFVAGGDIIESPIQGDVGLIEMMFARGEFFDDFIGRLRDLQALPEPLIARPGVPFGDDVMKQQSTAAASEVGDL